MTHPWRPVVVLLVTAALCACGKQPAVQQPQVQMSEVTRLEPDAEAPVSETATGIAAFGHDLLSEFDSRANVVISPASIATAFAMLRPAARGATAQEIDAVMHFPAEGLGAAFNSLTRRWETPSMKTDKAPELAIANAVWSQRGLSLEQNYLDALKRDFGAGVRTVDFTTPQAVEEINAWARHETRDRIKKLFERLSPDVGLVLGNAVYLKATWDDKFKPEDTQPSDFRLDTGSTVKVDTMHADRRFRYARAAGWAALQLPYADSDLSMWVLLPDEGSQLSPVDLLAPDTLAAARTSARRTSVNLALPRWDFQSRHELNEPLQALGMVAPFTGADFSGASVELADIEQVVQVADITVDEEGTEAAAVTGISARVVSLSLPSETEFHAERPFAFAIVDDVTGTPIFEGIVADPSQG